MKTRKLMTGILMSIMLMAVFIPAVSFAGESDDGSASINVDSISPELVHMQVQQEDPDTGEIENIEYDYFSIPETVVLTVTENGQKTEYQMGSDGYFYDADWNMLDTVWNPSMDEWQVGETYDATLSVLGHNFSITVKPGTHQHKLSLQKGYAATCNAMGRADYYSCDTCGKAFFDAEGQNEIQDDQWDSLDIPSDPSLHKLTHTPAVDATCTEPGAIEYWTCENCGNRFKSQDCSYENQIFGSDGINTPAKGHDYVLVEAKDATCGQDGCLEYYECSRCHKTFVKNGAEYFEKDASEFVVPKTGVHNIVMQELKRASLSTDGCKAHGECSDCHKVFIGEEEVSAEDLVIPHISTIKLSATSYTYNGKAKTPAVTVKDTAGNVVPAAAYTVKYSNNVNAGTANVTIKFTGDYKGTKIITYKIVKAANTLSIKAKTATVKYSAVKKKAQTLGVTKVITFSKYGQGAKTYYKKSGSSKITINKTNGKVYVAKGTKKGTYKIKVNVRAAGSANYASVTKAVTFTVKVK